MVTICMSDVAWFSFENKDLDFPFYKKNPYVSKWGWIVLFICCLMGLLLTGYSDIGVSILSCLVVIVPVLYFLKWDYHAIFQKPEARDVALAVILFVLYIVYSVVVSDFLDLFGATSNDLIWPETVTIMIIIPLFFSLMTEEFIKFIPFMFFLRVFYKYSNNRKISVIGSMLLVMVFFALLHTMSFEGLLFAICLQGFGSIFEFIGYIKTKNIFISYITHLCTDVFIFLLVMLGI